jgi:hypothetical protein
MSLGYSREALKQDAHLPKYEIPDMEQPGPIVNYFGPGFILTAQVYVTLRLCQPSCDWGVCAS